MLSRFSDPPRVFVPSPRVGFLLSQSCSSPTLLYISPIHSSSPTANCFILLRPTFFTLDRRFWLFPRPAHPARSLCSSIPPLHSLIHRRLLCQWQSTFPPPPHLMDSHLHGKHWVHFLWEARIGEEEDWILKPRTGNIVLPPNNLAFRLGGALEWPGWKSIKSKFAPFWPTAGSCFDFPQANFIYLYNITGPNFV